MTNLPDAVDEKRTINADTRVNPAFLQQTEDQISAIGSHIVGDKTRPFACCYPKVDPGVSAIPAGRAVAVRATLGPGDEPLIVLSTLANRAAGALPLGVLTEATSPGARGRIAVSGVVPPQFLSGITGSGSYVYAEDTTGALVRSTIAPSAGAPDFVGRITSGGALILSGSGAAAGARGIGSFAFRPVSAAIGGGYIDTTSYVESVYDGSAWRPLIGNTTLGHEPPSSGWSWQNQAGATLISNATQVITSASVAGNLISRVRTAPSAFDVYAHFRLQTYPTGNVGGGLVLYGSGTGRFMIAALRRNSSNSRWELSVQRWTTATAWASDDIALDIELPTQGFWFHCFRSGGSRVFTYSVDGARWTILNSVLDGAFLTPTDIGFGVVPDGGEANITLDSWQVV